MAATRHKGGFLRCAKILYTMVFYNLYSCHVWGFQFQIHQSWIMEASVKRVYKSESNIILGIPKNKNLPSNCQKSFYYQLKAEKNMCIKFDLPYMCNSMIHPSSWEMFEHVPPAGSCQSFSHDIDLAHILGSTRHVIPLWVLEILLFQKTCLISWCFHNDLSAMKGWRFLAWWDV